MRRTFAITPASDLRRSRAGYSVLEMLVVLALMALATTIVLPQGTLMLDRLVLHAVQFEFQDRLSTYRRHAFESQQAVIVVSSGQSGGAVAPLRAGWSYRLERPIYITAGGACSAAKAEVRRLGRTMMHLVASDASCHLLRLD